MCCSAPTGETAGAWSSWLEPYEGALMEDRYDNQTASSSIRMDATAHRCFPRDLVRVPGGKCRDVVPKCRGRVAHDELHRVSPLDRADADSNDAARFPCGLPRRGARRYREPPSTVARHPGPDPGRRRCIERPDICRAHERAAAARLYLRAWPWRDPGESSLASGQHGTRSSR